MGVERSSAIRILAIKTTEHFVDKSNKNERRLTPSIHGSSTDGMNAHKVVLNWTQIPKEVWSQYDAIENRVSYTEVGRLECCDFLQAFHRNSSLF